MRIAALGATVVALGALALKTTVGDASTIVTATVARDVKVDGHGVRWWANRARRNGAGLRWQKQRAEKHAAALKKLRAGLRERVDVGPYGVAAGLLCIHTHEGAWDANTGNGYYGGLQMDYSFMRAYGGEFLTSLGTADRWPPHIQVAVAMRAYYSGRGFGPWPNTRRMCGI